METMVKYRKDFKEQALLLSDEIGVKRLLGAVITRLQRGER